MYLIETKSYYHVKVSWSYTCLHQQRIVQNVQNSRRKNNSILLPLTLLALCAPLAHAALEIRYAINGGATVSCVTNPVSAGPAICGAVVTPGVTLTVTASGSNSPGTPSLATQLTTSLTITASADSTVDIWAVSQDFTNPVTPPALDYFSNLSTTSVTGSGTADLTSCLNTLNSLATTCAPGGLGNITLTNAQQAWTAPTATSGTVSTGIASLSPGYSMGQHITVFLNGGSQMNVIASQVLTPIPEPASMMLLGSALLGLSVAFRKKLVKR